ncbi:hypothetical protein OAH34_02130 [bacterium]|nr:hypothetical protein [bacterium]
MLTAVTFGESLQVVAKQRKATEVQAAANHLDQSSEIQCGVSLDGAMSWTLPAWTNSNNGLPLMKEVLIVFHMANGSHPGPIFSLNECNRWKEHR